MFGIVFVYKWLAPPWIASSLFIEGSWVRILIGALGFRTTFSLIKRSHNHPTFLDKNLNVTCVDRKKTGLEP